VKKPKVYKRDFVHIHSHLFAVVSDGLQDDTEGSHSDGHVQQVSGEEEVVVVTQDGEDEIHQLVDERLVGDGDTSLPNLVLPVNAQNAR